MLDNAVVDETAGDTWHSLLYDVIRGVNIDSLPQGWVLMIMDGPSGDEGATRFGISSESDSLSGSEINIGRHSSTSQSVLRCEQKGVVKSQSSHSPSGLS